MKVNAEGVADRGIETRITECYILVHGSPNVLWQRAAPVIVCWFAGAAHGKIDSNRYT